jgi:hypothetical protein
VRQVTSLFNNNHHPENPPSQEKAGFLFPMRNLINSSSNSVRLKISFAIDPKPLSLVKHLRVGLILLVCTAVSGCFSPKKKIAQNFRNLQCQWQTNVARQTALPERALTWPEAVAQLEGGNLKLWRAKADITNAAENVRQVFKDLYPTLNFRSGLSKSLQTLPTTSIDDVTFSIDSFFNIPGFVSMGTRLFAARLVRERAKAYYELTEREQKIELFKLFLAFDDQTAAEKQLEDDLAFARAIEKVEALAGSILLRDVETRSISLAKEREGLQDKAGDLLGNRDWCWKLVSDGLPEFRYDLNPLQLSDTNSVAQLQLRLAAIEFAGAWARIKGIQLQYWPDLTLFISGPPLYQRSGQSETFWNAGQIRANANFYWRIDTRGQIANQLRQTERDQAMQLARLRLAAVALIDKILAAQKFMGTLRQQADELHQLVPLLGQIPPAADYTGILKATENGRTLRDQERKLRRELAELNTLFWFVDETKWARHD